VRIIEDSRGLTISLAEAGFFDSGSAVMHKDSLPVVDRIAGTLHPLQYSLRVEGHTDNTPIHTAQFPSNWELSTARATFVLQYLISTTGISPKDCPRLDTVNTDPSVQIQLQQAALKTGVSIGSCSTLKRKKEEPPAPEGTTGSPPATPSAENHEVK
jgi:OmpA family protein